MTGKDRSDGRQDSTGPRWDGSGGVGGERAEVQTAMENEGEKAGEQEK